MSRETNHQAIVLKTSAFDEADEMITFLSREAGKIRALAKATKRPESRLRYALVPPVISSITITASNRLPKIIRAQPVQLFSNIPTDASRAAAWFVAAELTIRATPDEQKNEVLYGALEQFLYAINKIGTQYIEALVTKWKLLFLDAIGLGVGSTSAFAEPPAYFSNSAGGFRTAKDSTDAVPVTSQLWQVFISLNQNSIDSMLLLSTSSSLRELDGLLSSFIEYQLERRIQSESFLKQTRDIL